MQASLHITPNHNRIYQPNGDLTGRHILLAIT